MIFGKLTFQCTRNGPQNLPYCPGSIQDTLLLIPRYFTNILFVFCCCKICLGNMLMRYRGINNKGVLDRPWTIWKVLTAISSTLKCQFTENHENEKFWLFGKTEHRRRGVYKAAQCVSAHFCLAKTLSIAIWGQKIKFFIRTQFFQFRLVSAGTLV